MQVKCRDLTYDGNEDHVYQCTDIVYCDIPDN